MRDPWEGKSPAGTIVTGARRDRIVPAFVPVLNAAVRAVEESDSSASLTLYGSVATGQAQIQASDVDLLAVGLPAEAAQDIGEELTRRFGAVCREIAIATYPLSSLGDLSDRAYGDRVFLRHYVVSLSGIDHARGWPAFPADIRAARGFNGDIALHASRWQQQLHSTAPDVLARRLARKSLLAIAGLVSIHDGIWTTDRQGAARRWADLQPEHQAGLEQLLLWSDGSPSPSHDDVQGALHGVVTHTVNTFASTIGLWT
jgi:predicted nucleotidyltransferase